MRILLLTRSFNSLTQRLYVALAADGHELSVEFDIADSVTEEAVALFQPDVLIAPFLKRAIPASVWQRLPCLIVHPGPLGDRGPSALDWAIQQGETEWGVTVLQAEAEMDAGPVWAHARFRMRDATKSSLYRNEVTEAAVACVRQALAALASPGVAPERAPAERVRTRPMMRPQDRRIDWATDDTRTVLRKLHAADGVPGVLDALFDTPVFLFDAQPGPHVDAAPGALVARGGHHVLRATRDGSVWIGHCKRADRDESFKLPVAAAFAQAVAALPERAGPPEVWTETQGDVTVLHFPFYNGAMSSAQCHSLRQAYEQALRLPSRVLVLAGGPDFFSNGIHLNVIESAASPADESWHNIQAMDDLCEAILRTTERWVIAAMQGNAGAGGVFLALAPDEVWARDGVILNPHYKNMGNLYGSEYWTYTLPRRVRSGDPRAVMDQRLPIDAAQAHGMGLVDAVLPAAREHFLPAVMHRAAALAAAADFAQRLALKHRRRARDEGVKPLARYREEELSRMRRNFYGFDSSYHVARSYFVRKTPPSWTPRHLAVHRDN